MSDYSTIHGVCRECATSAGFVPKDKVVGVWIGECGICHKSKPCTDLHHDWNHPKGKPNNNANKGKKNDSD